MKVVLLTIKILDFYIRHIDSEGSQKIVQCTIVTCCTMFSLNFRNPFYAFEWKSIVYCLLFIVYCLLSFIVYAFE